MDGLTRCRKYQQVDLSQDAQCLTLIFLPFSLFCYSLTQSHSSQTLSVGRTCENHGFLFEIFMYLIPSCGSFIKKMDLSLPFIFVRYIFFFLSSKRHAEVV